MRVALAVLPLLLLACSTDPSSAGPSDAAVDADAPIDALLDAALDTAVDARDTGPVVLPCTAASAGMACPSPSYQCPFGSCTWSTAGLRRDALACVGGTLAVVQVACPGPCSGDPSDKSIGCVCTSDSDCDVTGSGAWRCTRTLSSAGPLNPTAQCVGFAADGADGCAYDPTTPTLCPGGTLLCSRSAAPVAATGPARCVPFCTVDATGKVTLACTGKNACTLESSQVFSGVRVHFGACAGGCNADVDCPAGATCDRVTATCVTAKCKADADCAAAWPTAAPGFTCDTAAGRCRTAPEKPIGSACVEGDPCLCVRGACVERCRTFASGSPCRDAGYVCDPLVAAGTLDLVPAGLGGVCAKACTGDGDCPTGLSCVTHAGVRTCLGS